MKAFQDRKLEPFPGLLAAQTGATAFVVAAPNMFFSSNWVEGKSLDQPGQTFRVQPNGSLILHEHVQAFREGPGRHHIYKVPLAFVVGVSTEEGEESFLHRLDALIRHALTSLGTLSRSA